MRLYRTRPRTKWAVAACAAATALIFSAGPALAADTSTRTATEVRAKWAQLRPDYAGSPYAATPKTTAPYAAGSLAPGFVDDGLDAMNYARYLAGLPADLSIDATYANRAQHGAVLLVAGGFSHMPARPAGMSSAFYDVGILGTSRGNIGWGQDSLWRFTFACMDDSAAGNLDRVGHRRWILNPELKKTGLGYTAKRSDVVVFDRSRAGTPEYSSVKWPSEGVFPVQLMDARTPWSVTLNPAKYDWTSGGHAVTMRRLSDNKTWSFTAADTNRSGEYFRFDTGSYGVANCFIFRPDPASLGAYRVGDTFEVLLSGGIYRQGTSVPVTVAYRTTMISQNQPDAFEPDNSRSSASAVLAGPPRRHSLDNPSDTDWACVDAVAGKALDLTVVAGGGRDGEVAVCVVGPAGTELLDYEVPAGTVGYRRWVAPATGRYYVATRSPHGFDAYAQPRYTLSLAPRSAITLRAPSTCAYLGPAKVSGTLRSATGAGLASRSVTIQQMRAGGTWTNLRTVTTGTGGAFSTTVAPGVRTYYRARFDGDSVVAASVSQSTVVSPRVRVSSPSVPDTSRASNTFSVWAYMRPRHAAGSRPLRFLCYRYEGGRWVHKLSVYGKAANSGDASRVSASLALPSSGRWRIRAVHYADGQNAQTYSDYDYILVR